MSQPRTSIARIWASQFRSSCLPLHLTTSIMYIICVLLTINDVRTNVAPMTLQCSDLAQCPPAYSPHAHYIWFRAYFDTTWPICFGFGLDIVTAKRVLLPTRPTYIWFASRLIRLYNPSSFECMRKAIKVRDCAKFAAEYEG